MPDTAGDAGDAEGEDFDMIVRHHGSWRRCDRGDDAENVAARKACPWLLCCLRGKGEVYAAVPPGCAAAVRLYCGAGLERRKAKEGKADVLLDDW